MAFVDLDRFKEINDVHGHDAGDAVLVETARRLQQAVRESDVVARVGGDEFVLVMEMGSDSVDALIERITQSVEQPIPLPDGTTALISASVGVADTNHADKLDALLSASDDAMYENKQSRRPQEDGWVKTVNPPALVGRGGN